MRLHSCIGIEAWFVQSNQVLIEGSGPTLYDAMPRAVHETEFRDLKISIIGYMWAAGMISPVHPNVQHLASHPDAGCRQSGSAAGPSASALQSCTSCCGPPRCAIPGSRGCKRSTNLHDISHLSIALVCLHYGSLIRLFLLSITA